MLSASLTKTFPSFISSFPSRHSELRETFIGWSLSCSPVVICQFVVNGGPQLPPVDRRILVKKIIVEFLDKGAIQRVDLTNPGFYCSSLRKKNGKGGRFSNWNLWTPSWSFPPWKWKQFNRSGTYFRFGMGGIYRLARSFLQDVLEVSVLPFRGQDMRFPCAAVRPSDRFPSHCQSGRGSSVSGTLVRDIGQEYDSYLICCASTVRWIRLLLFNFHDYSYLPRFSRTYLGWTSFGLSLVDWTEWRYR